MPGSELHVRDVSATLPLGRLIMGWLTGSRFMQSDPWWALAMSINVFLVFFIRTSPDTFQKWLWLYCLVCYGGPFVIALGLLLARPRRGLIYGEATVSRDGPRSVGEGISN